MYLASGIPFGLIVGLASSGLFFESITSSIIIGILAFIIFGLVQATIASLFSRSVHVSGCSFFILAGILCLVGLLSGVLSFWVMSIIPQGQWYQLDSPPEKAVEIIDNSASNHWNGNIYVRTISNKILFYDCSIGTSCQWVEVNSIPTESGEDKGFPTYAPCFWVRYYPTPSIPGKVVSSQKYYVVGGEATEQLNYVLLEDGSIWEWVRVSNGLVTLVFPPLLGFIGMLIGFFSSFVARDRKIEGVSL
jgi:hypothetical protein